MRLTTIKICLGLAAASLGADVTANEQNNSVFVGAGISYVTSESLVEESTDEKELSFAAAEFVAGYKFNRFLGLDVRLGAGTNEKRVDAAEAETADRFEFSVDGYQSIYYRPELSNREAKLYALIGYTQLDLAVSLFDSTGGLLASNTTSESGSSYGLGAGWFVGDDININLEYRMLLDSDEQEFEIVTLGFDYRFHL